VVFAAAFTGLLATSVAFGIQTLAQRFTTTTHTALIFAAEPVFAALFSFLLIGEVLGPRQLLGCGLILAGMMAGKARREAQS
jgi:drug/metabolite transporter (DMT)-like permease